MIIVGNYRLDTPIYDILVKLRSILTNGKLARIEKKGKNISVTCPFHSEGLERRNSCGFDSETGTYNCFTCGSKGFIDRFVAAAMDSSLEVARKWLITNFGTRLDEVNVDLELIELTKPAKPQFLDESILDSMQSWHPYMDKRHLSRKICELFKVKYDPNSESIVFPVYDEQGRLLMLTRRSVKNKTFIIDKDKEKPVYLMNYILDKKYSEVVVCESQINALTAFSWGYPSVATFGCNVTPKQMEIFNRSGLTHIYLCYDGDDAGRHGTQKFIEGISKGILVDVIIMPQGKDVNDITREEFESLPIISSQDWLVKYQKKGKVK